MSLLDEIQQEANANYTPETPQVETPEVATQETVVENEVTQVAEATNENNVIENTQTQTQQIAEPEKVITKKAFASDKVAELNAYLEKNPTKDISDWQKLKTPTDELDSKELLKQYYSDKEGMSEKEIAYELKQLGQDNDFDDEFEDEDDKLKREATMERELRKAREWRETHVAEQLADLNAENAEVQTPTDTVRMEDLQKQWQEQAETSRKSYLENVYSALPDMKSVEVNVNGEKVAFVPDEDFSAKMKDVAEHPEKVWQKFQNEDGSLKDSKGWIDLLLWGNEETREKLIDFRIEQAIIRDRQTLNNNRRNVSEDVNRGVSAVGTSEDEFAEYYNQKRKQQF